MTSKLKKTKSAGRFGARYGKRIRFRLVSIESRQRLKQRCPFCKKLGVKKLSKGVWQCKKCNKKFASDVYYLPTIHELNLSDKISVSDNLNINNTKNKKSTNPKNKKGLKGKLTVKKP